MILKSIEEKLNIKYPDLFVEIYDSGAMEWLKHSWEWFNQNRDEVSTNSNSFFYAAVGGDCEPILFDEILSYIDDFLESLEYDEEYKSGEKIINPEYKFIPFGKTGGGDIYFFFYENCKENPKITLFGHDTAEMDIWAKDFDEFLFLQLAESIIGYDLTFDDERIISHTKFLSDKYTKIFEYKDVTQLEKYIKDMGYVEKIEYIVDNIK